MVSVLSPIEVRTAAADEVPTVAAVLADAFINDPVFTFLRPGRLQQRARLRTMFVVEMEQYVLANWRKPIRLGYRRTSKPAASGARHSTSGSASCTWVCLSCQKPARRSGRCVGLRQGLMSIPTTEEIGAQASLRNAGGAQSDLLWTRDIAEVISIQGRPERAVTGSDDQQLRS